MYYMVREHKYRRERERGIREGERQWDTHGLENYIRDRISL